MSFGGKRVAILPSNIGYGPSGMSSFGIPPDATLVYYLEVQKPKLGAKGDL